MNALLSTHNLCLRLKPVHQAYLVIGIGLMLQYSLNALTYFQLFPDVAGKSINGIVKNSTYLIPGVLAVVAVLYFEGRAGCLRIFKPYTKVPLNPFWWFFAAVSIVPVLLAALYFNDLLYQRDAVLNGINFPSWSTIKEFSPLIIQVALCDELFWIGFVYPRLLHAGFSPLKASLAMGVFWGLEYLPFIFTNFFVSPGLSVDSLVLGWFALTPLYIWLYHKTQSALIIVFFNLCMQFTYSAIPILPQAVGDNSAVAMANLLTFIVGVLFWVFFPKGKKNSVEELTCTRVQTIEVCR